MTSRQRAYPNQLIGSGASGTEPIAEEFILSTRSQTSNNLDIQLIEWNAIQGTWNYDAAASEGFIVNSSADVNDYIEWRVHLVAGTYDLQMALVKTAPSRIMHVTIDGADEGTIDGYNSSTTSAAGTLVGITVPTTGYHLLRLTIATKNASSSDFLTRIVKAGMVRTGA